MRFRIFRRTIHVCEVCLTVSDRVVRDYVINLSGGGKREVGDNILLVKFRNFQLKNKRDIVVNNSCSEKILNDLTDVNDSGACFLPGVLT